MENNEKEFKFEVHLDDKTIIKATNIVGYEAKSESMVLIDGRQYHKRHILKMVPIKPKSPSEIAKEMRMKGLKEIKEALVKPTEF